MRWQQFEALVAGKAPMPERAFAYALYYQISGNAEFGKQAVQAALAPGGDLRQVALVFDWCQDILTETQRRDLTARLEKSITDAPANDSVSTARIRAFAAIALFDHVPKRPQIELQRIARTWWEARAVPALKAGRSVIARDDAYALWELLHAMRDNTLLELRESFPRFFKDFPIEHLISYYPAAFPGPENDYYIGAMKTPTDPDTKTATLSRAAELAMVAYDPNGAESQVLQGFLMHDKYLLRGTFGTPYEFLWANPYQPGLSYYHVPLVYHNPEFGKLFIRSDWDNTARWFGYFDGAIQLFQDGQLGPVNPLRAPSPMSLKEAAVVFAQAGSKFRINLEEDAEAVFILGLKPRRAYYVEIDDREMFEAETDAGGILPLRDLPHGTDIGVRFQEAPALTGAPASTAPVNK